MRANSTGSTHERAKANHWCHFYSVYATTQEYRTVFFLAHTPCISRLHKGRGVGGPLRISHSSRFQFHQEAAHLPAMEAQLSPRGPRAQMCSCTARGSCSRRAPHRSGLASAVGTAHVRSHENKLKQKIDQAKTINYC